jgi:uncharacterized protein
MKKAVTLEFSELGQKVRIELDHSHSPKTVRAIIDNLPIRTTINRWGDELYTDETPVKVSEKNAKSAVSLMDVAYWPEGSAPCFFYGPTPISSKKQGQILPYSPVNVIGRIIIIITSKPKPANVQAFLKSVENAHVSKKVPVVLR